MSSIITITVNPCIDITASVPQLLPEKKLHCTTMKKEPGGGGINVSRVIKRLGDDTKAIYLAGGYTGEYFTKMLHKENVKTLAIDIENHTRENFVVEEELNSLQYRFGMPGPVVKRSEWMKCLDELSSLYGMKYIVASGSLTSGIPTDFFARIAVIAKQKNAKLVLDTSGEPLRAALNEGVYMIKPNLGELSFLAAVDKLNKASAIKAARYILNQKQCEVVVVSMGASGALLITPDTVEHVVPPKVKIKSTVGAGDSMVAGIVWGLSKNKPLKTALQYGVACGTAATMNDGTALCNIAEMENLFEIIRKK